ncbi:FlgO family outer membrane protein [Arsukibacterium ikkense]|uniref:FlgO family outer membrane protein n=1 Tax=Arsukibacterium ikkense TaxID=336831 RepID=UPI000699E534|nr:FlgO family outer membrane protein [Arsukibacterium ikkense]
MSKTLLVTCRLFVTSLSAALLLTGCSTLQLPWQSQQSAPSAQPYSASAYILTSDTDMQQATADYQMASYPQAGGLYASHKLLDDYVAELAMQLYQNSAAPLTNGTVAVAGFANLSPARDTLHPLGNALAERFLQQLPRYGISMVDHKLTGSITLTAAGDQVFSNRAGQIAANQHIDYVLSGTVQQSQRGAMVHVRIMNLKSNAVLASASQLIPQFVLDTEPFRW